MKKIYLALIVGILLVGIITASITLSNYIKVREKTIISTDLFCKEEQKLSILNKSCNEKTPQNLSLSNTNLKIDVLEDKETKREVLKIYSIR